LKALEGFVALLVDIGWVVTDRMFAGGRVTAVAELGGKEYLGASSGVALEPTVISLELATS